MQVLGLSAYYHDSAAALVRDGEIIAAAQEERFSRFKHDAGFPARAAAWCLDEAGVTLDRVDRVAFYDKPLLTFDRLLETYVAFAPRGFRAFVKAMPVWMRQKVMLQTEIVKALNGLGRGTVAKDNILFGFHHHSHAASAFYPSPFDKAAILVMDGVGEWATASLGHGDGARVTLTEEVRFPHSLGLLYSAFTYHLGFEVNEGEYKVMGLAPYGEPAYAQTILDTLIDLKDDGSFRLDLNYFNYQVGLTMTNGRFDAPVRRSAAPSVGAPGAAPHGPGPVGPGGHRGGGVAPRPHPPRPHRPQKTVLSGRRGPQLRGQRPAAAGRPVRGAVDPAGGRRRGRGIGRGPGRRPRGGRHAAPAQRRRRRHAGRLPGTALRRAGHRSGIAGLGGHLRTVGGRSADSPGGRGPGAGRVVGWFQGRMEFGPRALGNRSILGDARSPAMQRLINLKVKYRESFRPFAPVVLREDAAEWFDLDDESPYMLLVAPVKEERRRMLSNEEAARQGLAKLGVPRSEIPAVTHVDGSARIQTLTADSNPRLHGLITAFKARTGCGVLVNTSFNVRDEPIVCSPDDAWRCFMGTEIDMLVAGPFLVEKDRQG